MHLACLTLAHRTSTTHNCTSPTTSMGNTKTIATILLHTALPLASLYAAMHITQAITLRSLGTAFNFAALTTSMGAASATALGAFRAPRILAPGTTTVVFAKSTRLGSTCTSWGTALFPFRGALARGCLLVRR